MGLCPCVLTTGLLMLALVEYWALIGPPRGELDLLEDDVTRRHTVRAVLTINAPKRASPREFYKKMKKSKTNLQKYL